MLSEITANIASAPVASQPNGTAVPPRRPIRRTGLARRPYNYLDWALVLACLLTPITLFMIMTLNDRSMAIERAWRLAEDNATIFEQHAQNTFETYQLVASLLDEHLKRLTWADIEDSSSLRSYLFELVHDYPRISAISVMDRDGIARLTTFPPIFPVPGFRDRDYFVALRDEDLGTIVGQRVRAKSNQQDIFNIARRRTGPGGGFDGLVVISVTPDFFEAFWKQSAPANVTAIFQSGGRLLARYPLPPEDILDAKAGPEMLAAVAAADRGTTIAPSNVDGLVRIISFRKISGFQLYVVHAVDLDRVLRLWRAEALRNGSWFASATVGLLVLAMLVIRQRRRLTVTHGLLVVRTQALATEAGRRATAEADLASVLRDTVDRQEAERKNLARELHDSLGQHVAVLHLGLDSLICQPDGSTPTRDQAASLKQTATALSHEMGRLAWQLRPTGLDELGLETAIKTFIETMSSRTGLRIDLHIEPTDHRLSPAMEATLYRVLQEAITNVVKHAEATLVDVVLTVRKDQTHLIIEDNGRGFESDEVRITRSGKHLGLLGVRERLALIGGTLEIESEPGRGTTLFVKI